jgi:hypothetical protein
VTFDDVRRIMAGFEGCTESTWYGTPSFKHGKKTSLMRMKEDAETLVVKVDHDEKQALLQSGSDVYFTTNHYDGHPMILVRLNLIGEAELAELLELCVRINAG